MIVNVEPFRMFDRFCSTLASPPPFCALSRSTKAAAGSHFAVPMVTIKALHASACGALSLEPGPGTTSLPRDILPERRPRDAA